MTDPRDLWKEAIRIRLDGGDHALAAWIMALTPDEYAELQRQWDDARDAMRAVMAMIDPTGERAAREAE